MYLFVFIGAKDADESTSEDEELATPDATTLAPKDAPDTEPTTSNGMRPRAEVTEKFLEDTENIRRHGRRDPKNEGDETRTDLIFSVCRPYF